MYPQFHVPVSFSNVYLFLANGPQALYVNPYLPGLTRKVGCLKCISYTKMPAGILFALYCFKLYLQWLNYLGWLNETFFVFPYKKILPINGTLLRGALILNLLNN